MKFIEQLNEGIIAESEAETQRYANDLAACLPSESTLALYGDVGLGKTTFVRGLAAYWNIKETITSPTFNYFLMYKGSRLLVHLDAYRFVHPQKFEELLIDELLIAPFCLVIEWPENLMQYLPTDAWKLTFTYIGPTQRKLQLKLP
jgi:tRNA threonylcarbamoyladenosine biosynthesis protein TsaE